MTDQWFWYFDPAQDMWDMDMVENGDESPLPPPPPCDPPCTSCNYGLNDVGATTCHMCGAMTEAGWEEAQEREAEAAMNAEGWGYFMATGEVEAEAEAEAEALAVAVAESVLEPEDPSTPHAATAVPTRW
jgi:hypothetical protein